MARGHRTRDGRVPPFCFIPRDMEGRIPVPLSDHQVTHLQSLDPRTLTPGEREALAAAEAVRAAKED